MTIAPASRSFALDGPLAAWDNSDESPLARDSRHDIQDPEPASRSSGRSIDNREPTMIVFTMPRSSHARLECPGSLSCRVDPTRDRARPGQPRRIAHRLKPAPGLEATLWASEPMLVQPDEHRRRLPRPGLGHRGAELSADPRRQHAVSSRSTRPTGSRSSRTPTATARPTR